MMERDKERRYTRVYRRSVGAVACKVVWWQSTTKCPPHPVVIGLAVVPIDLPEWERAAVHLAVVHSHPAHKHSYKSCR